MDMHQSFLAALEENEDDTVTRLVYADWLEEQGEHEEADRQRRWPAAKEWMMKLVEAGNPDADEEEAYERVISYEMLLEMAESAAEGGDYYIRCGNNMSMCDELRDNSKEFWQNWSILSGVPVPVNVDEQSGYGCAC